MEKHGQNLVMKLFACHEKLAKKIKSWKLKIFWKSHGIPLLLITNHVMKMCGSHEKLAKSKVMEIENILEKSWNSSTAYHESCT